MIRRLPLVPTIIVAAAAALMIGLGIWQLQRARWKDALIAQYAAAQKLPPMAWPTAQLREVQLPLFRYATAVCLRPVARHAVVGENLRGEPGYVQVIDCATGPSEPGMSVQLGWSKDPNAKFGWSGGPVSGIIAPDRRTRMRLVADGAPPGLEQSAPPSLSSIPNNHRSYALQWFSFAAIALIIYALAVRKRLKETPQP